MGLGCDCSRLRRAGDEAGGVDNGQGPEMGTGADRELELLPRDREELDRRPLQRGRRDGPAGATGTPTQVEGQGRDPNLESQPMCWAEAPIGE